MKEIEHPALITEWTINIDKSVHKENLEKRVRINRHKKKKSIVAMVGNIGQRLLNMSLCGFFSMF